MSGAGIFFICLANGRFYVYLKRNLIVFESSCHFIISKSFEWVKISYFSHFHLKILKLTKKNTEKKAQNSSINFSEIILHLRFSQLHNCQHIPRKAIKNVILDQNQQNIWDEICSDDKKHVKKCRKFTILCSFLTIKHEEMLMK